jgi:hypothetical protein
MGQHAAGWPGAPNAAGRRIEIFQAIVEEQDKGVATVISRQRVAEAFGVTVSTIRSIEEEGLWHQWPPL